MKKIFLFLLIFTFSINIFAQEEDNEYSDDEASEGFKPLKAEKKALDLSRVRVGGELAVGFETNTFFAEVSPVIGYQIIKDRLEIGPGIIYQHVSRPKLAAINNIGVQAYIRGYLFDGIYAQVDGFIVNKNINYIAQAKKASYTYGNGFVGVGYAFNHKDTPFYMSISIKTNILTDSTYPNRLIIPKVSFQFAL